MSAASFPFVANRFIFPTHQIVRAQMATCFDSAGRPAVLLPAASGRQCASNMPTSVPGNVELDKPQHAPRARLRCELALELPKNEIVLARPPRWPFKMRPRREGMRPLESDQSGAVAARPSESDCYSAYSSSWMAASTLSAPSATLLIKARPLASITACRKPLIVNFPQRH